MIILVQSKYRILQLNNPQINFIIMLLQIVYQFKNDALQYHHHGGVMLLLITCMARLGHMGYHKPNKPSPHDVKTINKRSDRSLSNCGGCLAVAVNNESTYSILLPRGHF